MQRPACSLHVGPGGRALTDKVISCPPLQAATVQLHDRPHQGAQQQTHPEESEDIWCCEQRLRLRMRLVLEPDAASVVVGPPIDGRVEGLLHGGLPSTLGSPEGGAAKKGKTLISTCLPRNATRSRSTLFQ